MYGKPLMPTRRHGKAGRLLEDGKEKAAKLEPSAIQLLYDGAEYTQPISLGGKQDYWDFRVCGEGRIVRRRGGAED
jgi:hypothetical protein